MESRFFASKATCRRIFLLWRACSSPKVRRETWKKDLRGIASRKSRVRERKLTVLLLCSVLLCSVLLCSARFVSARLDFIRLDSMKETNVYETYKIPTRVSMTFSHFPFSFLLLLIFFHIFLSLALSIFDNFVQVVTDYSYRSKRHVCLQ